MLIGRLLSWDQFYARERTARKKRSYTDSPTSSDDDGDRETEDKDGEEDQECQEDGEDEDEGSSTNWFSEHDASGKIITFLQSLTSSTPSPHVDSVTEEHVPRNRCSLGHTSFLDLGTGNGHLLLQLRERGGFNGRMLGLDYSHESIALARSALDRRRQAAEQRPSPRRRRRRRKDVTYDDITFDQCDLLDEQNVLQRRQQQQRLGTSNANDDDDDDHDQDDQTFDVLLDKGTFDAISLSADRDELGRRVCENYAAVLLPWMTKDGGILIVTSCNWTEHELIAWFTEAARSHPPPREVVAEAGHTARLKDDHHPDASRIKVVEKDQVMSSQTWNTRNLGSSEDDQVAAATVVSGKQGPRLQVLDRIAYPSFTFGGRQGQSISSVAFVRLD